MVELRVNESALLQRVETRVAEMRARGEEVRIDDTPEVLTKRLASYRSLTEPLIHYYSERRKLLTVDGMMTIEHVTREINRILAAIGAVEAKTAKKAPRESEPSRPPKGRLNRPPEKHPNPLARAPVPRKRAPRAPERPGKRSPKAPKSHPARPSRVPGPVSAGKTGKAAKKVTKKRAKA